MQSSFDNQREPYFIGEIGINHNGDLQIAKKLIDGVFACGWNCVKFQKRNPDVSIPENQKSILKDTPWGCMTYLEYKHRMEFGKSEFDYIDKYCHDKPLHWSASVWDLDSLDFLLRYEVPFIKIPSAMICNSILLKEAAQSKIQLVVSTGMSTLDEIDHAVDLIMKHGVKPILMHTNSSYPTPRDEINLNLIPFLSERYNCIIGYSGHEPDLEPTVVAVTLGAKLIERHITLSHEMWGTDQHASLEIMGMDILRKRCQDIHIILGSRDKCVTKSEMPIRDKLRGNVPSKDNSQQ